MIAAQRQGEAVVVPDEVMWLDEHPPIAQAIAVMKRAEENPAAAFWVRQLRSGLFKRCLCGMAIGCHR